jgi:hypothetical protein
MLLGRQQMKLVNRIGHQSYWKASILMVTGCVLLSACRSRVEGARPSIEFTRVPPAEMSRTDKLDIIQGRVAGPRPGQQIVLYARTGAWWIQPVSNYPFTALNADSTWINSTHLGTEYAALLVEPAYRPEPMMNVLPDPGGDVAAIGTTEGATSGPTVNTPILFSGYEWRTRTAPSHRGGTMNMYDPANVWTDEGGAMHLKMTKDSGQLTCAEVTLTRSFGNGTYSFVVRDTSQLEPAVAFDIFTYDYAGGDQNNREMNIQISRWGDPASKNAQYEIQPFYIPANVARFSVPPGVVTHSFRWEPGRVSFRTFRGDLTERASEIIGEHVFTSGVPSPGAESVRMAIYVFGSQDNLKRNEAEVIVDKFEYLP